jgi:hypothetical protein
MPFCLSYYHTSGQRRRGLSISDWDRVRSSKYVAKQSQERPKRLCNGTTLRNSARWELYPKIQQRRRIFGNNMACPKLCSRLIPCCWQHEEESTHHHHHHPPNILEFCLSPYQHYQAGLTRWQIGRGRGTVSILIVCSRPDERKQWLWSHVGGCREEICTRISSDSS